MAVGGRLEATVGLGALQDIAIAQPRRLPQRTGMPVALCHFSHSGSGSKRRHRFAAGLATNSSPRLHPSTHPDCLSGTVVGSRCVSDWGSLLGFPLVFACTAGIRQGISGPPHAIADPLLQVARDR